MRKFIALFAVLGMVLALAPAAQAAIVAPIGYDGPYRIAFKTDSIHTASNTNISFYNAIVDAEGDTELVSDWRVIASTSSIDARDNTGTTATNGLTASGDVPIYNTLGEKIWDGNTEMWDGATTPQLALIKALDGGNPTFGDGQRVWAGTAPDGTAETGNELGAATVSRGINSVSGHLDGNQWIDISEAGNTTELNLYGLSGVLDPSAPFIDTSNSDPVLENQPTNTAVWSFFMANTNGSFTYDLSEPAPDNAAFAISDGSNLVTAAVFDLETQTNYVIDVRATEDGGGLILTNTFSVAVSKALTPAAGGYPAYYRVAFVTTGTDRPTNSVIAYYNAYVSAAAAGVDALSALGTTWACIGSTVAVDARDNTGTQSNGVPGYLAANDVPIYTTDGNRIADNNADLWDGSIQNPIYFDDGTQAGVVGGAQERAWTGTQTDGTSADAGTIPGDGNPLGSGPSPNNIRLVRGGYTDGNWISGPTDHDASAKHYLAMSAVIDNSANVAVWELGGAANWNSANWTVGGVTNQLPSEGSMFVDVAGAAVTLAAPANANDLVVGSTAASSATLNSDLTVSGSVVVGPSGTLTVGAAGTLDTPDLHVSPGATFDLNGNDLSVANALTLGVSLDMTGAALDVSNATVTLNGGTLTDDAALSLDTLSINGGALAVPGTITASTTFSFEPVTTLSNNLAGTAELVIGESQSADGLVTLKGANTYSGETTIHRGTLAVNTAADLGPARLLFNSANELQPAVLMTRGTLTRTNGSAGAQSVAWSGHGGFAASDAALTVTLDPADDPGGPIEWTDNTFGFANKVLQLGALTAEAAVELSSDITINAGFPRVYTFDNPNSSDDISILSGNLLRDGSNNRWLYKNGAGTLWLTGTNAFNTSGNTGLSIDGGYASVVRATEGVGLPTNSVLNLERGVFESSGNFTRSIGNAAGEVNIASGWGFSAYGAPLDIYLNSPTPATPTAGVTISLLNHQTPYFGSATADSVMTLHNNINGLGFNRTFTVMGNPNTSNDYAVIDGNVMNCIDLHVYGEPYGNSSGELVINGDVQSTAGGRLRVSGGAKLHMNGTATMGGVLTVDHFSTLGGTGTIAGGPGDYDLRGTIAPGYKGAGTLSINVGGQLSMHNNLTYEWELGPSGTSEPARVGTADTLEITAGLLTMYNFVLKILDTGGYVESATDRVPVLTYSGATVNMDGFGNDANNFDTNSLTLGANIGEWQVTTLALTNVVADSTIYLTGLSGGTPPPPPAGLLFIVK